LWANNILLGFECHCAGQCQNTPTFLWGRSCRKKKKMKALQQQRRRMRRAREMREVTDLFQVAFTILASLMLLTMLVTLAYGIHHRDRLGELMGYLLGGYRAVAVLCLGSGLLLLVAGLFRCRR
jgi:nitrogen fixation/metabolism regulation signal transduction histidine kinase